MEATAFLLKVRLSDWRDGVRLDFYLQCSRTSFTHFVRFYHLELSIYYYGLNYCHAYEKLFDQQLSLNYGY